MARSEPVHFPDRDTDARRRMRRALSLQSVMICDRVSQDVWIHDMSETGVLLECPVGLPNHALLSIRLPEHGMTQARVAWSNGAYAGCEFIEPMRKAAVSAAALASRPLAREANRLEPASTRGTLISDDQPLGNPTKIAVIAGASVLGWALVIGSMAWAWA